MDADKCSNHVIGAAIAVHRILGPGLLESAYESALGHELRLRGLSVESQIALPISYKGLELPNAYRIDLIVENLVVVEVKSVEMLLPLHTAQLITYLKFSELPLGLLLNFNATSLRSGVKRLLRKS